MKNKPLLIYIKTNEIIKPRTKPPITAPIKLSSQPITAAIKPETKSNENSIESGDKVPFPLTV